MCVGEQARASVQGEPGAEQWVTAAAAVTAGVLLDPAAGTHYTSVKSQLASHIFDNFCAFSCILKEAGQIVTFILFINYTDEFVVVGVNKFWNPFTRSRETVLILSFCLRAESSKHQMR